MIQVIAKGFLLEFCAFEKRINGVHVIKISLNMVNIRNFSFISRQDNCKWPVPATYAFAVSEGTSAGFEGPLNVIGEERWSNLVSPALRLNLAFISEPMVSISSCSLLCPIRSVSDRILLSEKNAKLELVTAYRLSVKTYRERRVQEYQNFPPPNECDQ